MSAAPGDLPAPQVGRSACTSSLICAHQCVGHSVPTCVLGWQTGFILLACTRACSTVCMQDVCVRKARALFCSGKPRLRPANNLLVRQNHGASGNIQPQHKFMT
eukprot:1161265-Pelagomonas_calceolata.AAC.2